MGEGQNHQDTVTIVSFGHFEKDFLEAIASSVDHEFQCRVALVEAHNDLSSFFDPGRRQYNGNKLLQEVDLLHADGSSKTIGLFTVDLFIPILTYIFGQAYLNGRSGIASVFRLKNERYGMPPDPKLQLDRFIKEVNHELGHMYGLVHCQTQECVMRSSTYVEDIDQKTRHLCPACREKAV